MPVDNPPSGGKPKMKKSTIWILVGGGAVGLIGVLWFMRSKNSAANQQNVQAQQGIDPSTGIPYADEYGGGGMGGALGVSPSLYGYTGPTGSTIYPGVSGQVVTAPSTNAGWAQEVEAYLQNLGYDPTTVAAALGKYLTGGRLTSDQQSIVQAGLGFFGNPPTTVPPISLIGGGGGGQTTPPIIGGKPAIHPVPLTKADFTKSGWLTINGVQYWFSKARNTLGFKNAQGKWQRIKV